MAKRSTIKNGKEVRILPQGEEREWTQYSSDLAQKALRGVSNDSPRKER